MRGLAISDDERVLPLPTPLVAAAVYALLLGVAAPAAVSSEFSGERQFVVERSQNRCTTRSWNLR